MKAPDLTFRVAFDRPTTESNGGGGLQVGWAEAHQCLAAMTFLRGGEVVKAARLEGRQPAVATIRDCAGARGIGTGWRMRDLRAGVIYAVRAIVPTADRRWIEVTVESGVPA